MQISVQSGTYVVAVSGGVDSMVLLHLLMQLRGLDLIVAHFDHGIRPDSAEDRQLVEQTAAQYNLPFFYETGKLGAGTSEATARAARYAFLERVRTEQNARAIITAHHQDDSLETAILNLLRGTGRKGLTALSDRPTMLRPLLHLTKGQLLEYATEHHLIWHEDSTNTQDQYLRNYIRHHIVPRLTLAAREQLLATISATKNTNQQIDALLADILAIQTDQTLNRRYFMQLPHDVAKELLASWLRRQGIANFDAKTLERLTVAAKVQAPGSIMDVIGGAKLRVTKDNLALEYPER